LESYSNEAFDTRFKQAGFTISEKDLQESSGVLQALLYLPLYKQTNMEAESIKERVIYDFWTRSTIPWKLECE